jgi:hypothetical protein
VTAKDADRYAHGLLIMEELSDNQKIQRCQLEKFKRCYSDFPEGRWEYPPPPDPDLMVYTNGGVLGIEHTRIFRTDHSNGIVRQEQESLEERIVNRAREIYEQYGGPPLHVAVSFNSNIRLGKKDVASISTFLAGIVARYIPDVGQQVILEASRFIPRPFPREVDIIFIDRYGKSEMFWTVYRGDTVPTLTTELIEDKIQNKEAKREKYLSRCSKIWLLIVETGGAPSSHFDIPRAVVEKVYKSNFDRIFLLKDFGCEAIELKAEP